MNARPAWTDARLETATPFAASARLAAGSGAVVLHLHGGGFTAGSAGEGSRIAGLLAETGAAVVSLDYPLAPANPFPAALEAAYDALRWAQRERRRLAGARAGLYVVGEEAGANLAAALALMARDRDGPTLAGQVLFSPMVDLCCGTRSQRMAQAGAKPSCPFAEAWRQYLQRAADVEHPYAAPGGSIRLGGLAPTLLVTAHDDPLRDETRGFARRLAAAGVDADTLDLPHPTGWPRAYAAPAQADHETAWAAPVRARLQRFLFKEPA
jgi:acetyl esterase